MMKLKIKCLLATLFILAAFIPTHASNEGSITISLEEAGIYTSIENVEFTIYKITELNNGLYEINEEYDHLSIDLNSLNTSEELDEASDLLASYILDNKLDQLKTSKTNEQGICTFENLDVAVYLVVASDTTHYDDIKPTIVAIPTFNDTTKQMDYDVEVYPKHSPTLITIELLKLDEDNKTTPLKDAVFTLFDHEQNEIQTAVTNTDGIAVFEYVPFGDYVIKETEAPKGYQLTNEEIEITIDGAIKKDGIIQLNIFNEKLPSYQTGDNEPVSSYFIIGTASFSILLLLFISKKITSKAK